MPVDDVLQDGIELGQEAVVAGGGMVSPDGLNVPQCGVDGVVLRLLAGVGETVGQHATIDEARKGQQNLPGDLRPAGDQGQAGQADHGIAAPVAKPGIAGNHRAAGGAIGLLPRHDELVGCQHKVIDGPGEPTRLRVHRGQLGPVDAFGTVQARLASPVGVGTFEKALFV